MTAKDNEGNEGEVINITRWQFIVVFTSACVKSVAVVFVFS